MSSEDFNKIEDYKNDITRIIDEVDEKCIQLDTIYKRYIKQTETKSDFNMSLDTLFFQISLTKRDAHNYTELFNLFLYQMYGQYYKLLMKMTSGYSDNLELLENVSSLEFLAFDDISYKMYPFEETSKIHGAIVNLIATIKTFISKSEYEIEDDTIRVNKGIGIDNLVFEKRHCVDILSNKNKLHTEMLNKMYKYQKKTLSRIMLKIKLLYFQIASDIQFESFNYTKRESITNNLNNKLKNVAYRQNFEDLLMEEFKDRTDTGRFTSIIKFFNRFLIYT